MPKVELTVESLAQVVKAQGLQAAKVLISERAEALQADRIRQQQSILAAEEAIKGIDAQLSQIETLLIGAVKKASQEMGIPLAAPAMKVTKGTRISQAKVAEKVAGYLRSAGPNGLPKKSIMDMLAREGMTPADGTVTNALISLINEKKAAREGISRSTRYKAL
ncbi:MAG: hypothetical protein ACE15C_12450 [Phycisphaerae bacterium]